MTKRNHSCKIEKYYNFCQDQQDQPTRPASPQDFRFMSLQNINKKSQKSLNRKQSLKWQQISKSNSNYQSYRSFTDLMQYEIKLLIEQQQNEQQKQQKQYGTYIQQFKQQINKYFQMILSTNYQRENIQTIYGQQQLTFQQQSIEKTLELNQILSMEDQKNIVNLIQINSILYKFLVLIFKDLPIQFAFQILIITYEVLKKKQQGNEIEWQQISENCFYDNKIKYINFRFTKIDINNDHLKSSFQQFVSNFSQLIIGITSPKDMKQENYQQKLNTISIRRYGLYSSKDDIIRSDDQDQEINYFIPRKRSHLIEN